jgi:hypothetical protein
MTTAEPKRPFAMAAAASATALSGATVNTSAVMISASSTNNALRDAEPVAVPAVPQPPSPPTSSSSGSPTAEDGPARSR